MTEPRAEHRSVWLQNPCSFFYTKSVWRGAHLASFLVLPVQYHSRFSGYAESALGSPLLGPALKLLSIQFSSVAQSCLTLCDLMNCSTPGLPVHHQLLEPTQTHVHWVSDAIQSSHPLLSPSPPALNLSQNQALFKWVSSSHQVAKVLEFQFQHQGETCFWLDNEKEWLMVIQWIFRVDFL